MDSNTSLTSGEDSVIKITDYFKMPKQSTIIAILLVTLMIFSYFIHIVNNQPISRSVASAFFITVLPTLLIILTFSLLIRTDVKSKVFLMVILTSAVLSLIYSVGLLFKNNFFYIVVVGYGLIVFSWYLLLNLILGFKKSAVILALIMITYYSIFLFMDSEYRTEGLIESLFKIYLSSIIFILGVVIIFLIINAPMKNRFGIKSTDAITQFSQQWLEGDKKLEHYFRKVGVKVETDVKIISFKRDNDLINLIIPNIHFGPFGNLGGSAFPYQISEKIDGKNIILHGTVTHDFDPVSTDQIKPILDACHSILKDMKYEKGYFEYFHNSDKKSHASIDMLVFNRYAITGLSLYPDSSEDIEYGIGMALVNYQKRYYKDAAVFDEHNSDTGHVTPIRIGSPLYNKFIDLIDKAKEEPKRKRYSPICVGYSSINTQNIENRSLGSAGIKCLAIGDKKKVRIIFLVLDSNNITPNAKHAIEKQIKSIGIENVIISTTDTHENNAVKGVINPFDMYDFGALNKKIVACVKNAIQDLKPAKIGFGQKNILVYVLGQGMSTEIVSIFNSLISITKILIPLVLIIATIAILFALKSINI